MGSEKTRSWWGWGNVEDAVRGAELDALTRRVTALLPAADLTAHEAPDPRSLGLPAARIAAADLTSAAHGRAIATSRGVRSCRSSSVA